MKGTYANGYGSKVETTTKTPTIVDAEVEILVSPTETIDPQKQIWGSKLNADQHDYLDDIAHAIMKESDKAVVNMIKTKLVIGRKLIQARELFAGDKEFGRWRKQYLSAFSATEAAYCMRAVRVFGDDVDALIAQMSWTAMRELSYAPETLIELIKENPEEAPSNRREAREAIEKHRDEGKEEIVVADEVTGEATVATVATEPYVPPKVHIGRNVYDKMTMEQRWRYLLTLPTSKRLEYVLATTYDAFIVFGLAPDTEIAAVSPHTLLILHEGLVNFAANEEAEILNLVKRAFVDLESMYAPLLSESENGQYGDRFEFEFLDG